MSQQLGALAAFPEDNGLVPNNHPYGGEQQSAVRDSGNLMCHSGLCGAQTHMQTEHPCT